MTIDENKALLVRHFEEILNLGKLGVVDEIYADDYVLDAPVKSDGSSQARDLTRGREGLKQRVTLFRTSFPDIHFTMDEVVAEGNAVTVQYTFRGTHRGAFAGLDPTSRTIDVVGILIAHIEDGKIQDARSVFDSADMMRQLSN